MNESTKYFEGIIYNKLEETLTVRSFDYKELDFLQVPKDYYIPVGFKIPDGLKIDQSYKKTSKGDAILWLNLVDKDF